MTATNIPTFNIIVAIRQKKMKFILATPGLDNANKNTTIRNKPIVHYTGRIKQPSSSGLQRIKPTEMMQIQVPVAASGPTCTQRYRIKKFDSKFLFSFL
ncbi:MAG: hypothetical protein ACI8WB_005459 [Phenylobacterium sp.]|jgi:hypothetical protein